MPIEHINKTDTLNDGRVKINDAIDGANDAVVDAGRALTVAGQANTKSDSAVSQAQDTQQQLDNIVIESGTSDAEVIQARGDEPLLKDRLNKTDSLLADTAQNLESRSFNVKYPPFPLSPALGDNVVDDILAINNIMQVMEDGDTLTFPRGRYRATESLVINKNINLVMHGLLSSDHAGEAIILEDLGIATALIPELKIKVLKRNLDFSDASVGVLAKNSYNAKLRFDYVGNFSTGILLTAEGSRGTVYNEISLGQIYNNKTQIHITAKNPSWANQNNFFGGRLYYATGSTRVGFVHIKIDGASNGAGFYGCNGNNFFGTSMEDVGVNGEFAKVAEINGHSNHFFSPRTEGSLIWHFGDSSFRNKVDGGTYITLNNIVDEGKFNTVVTQGSGSYQSVQTPGYSNRFVAGANNTTGLEAVGDGPSRIPARFWNEGATGYPAMQIMERDGETVAGEFRANGAWIVRGGNRSVFWGVHLGAPASGSYNRGDLSFLTNPSLGDPIGYVCVTSGSPGTWRAFGQIGAKASITSSPDYAGQTAVVSGVAYIATGTASSADWKRIT